MTASALTGTGTRARNRQFAGAPSSGTSGALATVAEPGAILFDNVHGVAFINEGTKASPYWTPLSMDQWAMFGVHDDFKDNVGVAVSGSAASVIKAGSGLRVFGQGHAVNDSGLVVLSAGEGGINADLTTTDEAEHLLAVGMSAGVMQPDAHSLLVVEATFTMETALTDRRIGLGFLGTAADALDPPVTGSGTTATLVQDDLALMIMDSGLTDADGIFAVHNKSNADATQDLAADGDLSATIAAVGTFQRWRVEIAADGDMTCFINKAQVYSQAIALDVDEECSPVLYVAAVGIAIKKLTLHSFAAYAFRNLT